jgi:hypothetical protein
LRRIRKRAIDVAHLVRRLVQSVQSQIILVVRYQALHQIKLLPPNAWAFQIVMAIPRSALAKSKQSLACGVYKPLTLFNQFNPLIQFIQCAS